MPPCLLHPLRDKFLGTHISNLTSQLHLISGDLTLVFNAKLLSLEIQHLDKGDIVPLNSSFGDLRGAEIGLGGSGDLTTIYLEFLREGLDADLGFKRRRPFAGNISRERRRDEDRRQSDELNPSHHGLL